MVTMRILHIVDGIPPTVLGGTGRIVLEVARSQQRAGHDVGILSAATAGTLPDTLDGIRLLSIEPQSERTAHYRSVFSRTLERSVLKIIDVFQPNIVHAHTISRQVGYRWMSEMKRCNIKLIVTCHDVSHISYGKIWPGRAPSWWQDFRRYRWSWNPFRHMLIRSFLKNADQILTVSDALKTELELHKFPPMQTVHNGIDLSFWKPSMTKQEARQVLKLPTNRFLFLLAGRMGFDKGSTLIAATLPKNADLVLAGDRFSDEFAPVKDRMHIFYNQSAEEMRLQYAASDIVLVPSRCLDCFPTVCLEAMAMQRPVLATSWGGAKESVEDGKTGWILDPFDENAWREKMAWCLSHPQELAAAGDAGRARMEKEFSITMMINQLEKVYAESM